MGNVTGLVSQLKWKKSDTLKFQVREKKDHLISYLEWVCSVYDLDGYTGATAGVGIWSNNAQMLQERVLWSVSLPGLVSFRLLKFTFSLFLTASKT